MTATVMLMMMVLMVMIGDFEGHLILGHIKQYWLSTPMVERLTWLELLQPLTSSITTSTTTILLHYYYYFTWLLLSQFAFIFNICLVWCKCSEFLYVLTQLDRKMWLIFYQCWWQLMLVAADTACHDVCAGLHQPSLHISRSASNDNYNVRYENLFGFSWGVRTVTQFFPYFLVHISWYHIV